jgi:aryl carrier-like protein
MTGTKIGTETGTEAALCRILAEVLQVDVVAPEDGFFEVGGDSVLAVAVVARAREAGLVLGVRDLFDHQTARSLAAAIGDRSGPADGTATTPTAPEAPLVTFADDEFGDFEQAGATEAEWETIT